MRMIHKTYTCYVPDSILGDFVVSAWMAPGSNTVNIRTCDNGEWFQDLIEHGLPAVMVEKMSDYAHKGVKTLDDLIDYLYYIKP